MKLDEKEIKILKLLKENSNLTTSQIAKKINMPITTIHNRIKKLKQNGVIKNYTINLDYEKTGKPLKAHVLITANQNKHSQKEISKKIKSLEDVESVDIITGKEDIIVTIRAETINSLNNLLTNKIRNIEGVNKTETMIVLEEI